jgi:mannose-6-phosphate isomerase-like protein (cupin superfamily)
MSYAIAEDNPNPRYPKRGSLYVPAKDGVNRWFDGAVSTIKLRAADTHGTLGLIEASIPPGAGPAAHAHADTDETFYLLSGELEMRDGDAHFRIGPGDLVFVPRGSRHGFTNLGIHPARVLILFTPGGLEGIFVEGGQEAQPGVPVPHWGADRWTEHFFIELFRKYRTEAQP